MGSSDPTFEREQSGSEPVTLDTVESFDTRLELRLGVVDASFANGASGGVDVAAGFDRGLRHWRACDRDGPAFGSGPHHHAADGEADGEAGQHHGRSERGGFGHGGA